MKQIFKNISLVILTILVVSLSMGFNISKMKCDDSGSLYLGSTVPSCSEENEVICTKDEEKASCCMIEVKESCCPETKDMSCASSTQSFHFDFETLVSFSEFDFKQIKILLYTCFSYSCPCNLKQDINYPKWIDSQLYKPELAEINSFLL